MTVVERSDRYPYGELIVPDGHIVLRSIYQFKDSTEVYAFLHGCVTENCSVYFQNEDICVDREGRMSIPDIGIAVYMHMKNHSKMVEDYLRFALKASGKEWAIDRVEVI